MLALRDAVSRSVEGEALSIGRDGASDAISFLEAGIPAVEFGPVGGGHHGPEEWVSIASLARYRSALGDFVLGLPARLAHEAPAPPPLRAVDGGARPADRAHPADPAGCPGTLRAVRLPPRTPRPRAAPSVPPT